MTGVILLGVLHTAAARLRKNVVKIHFVLPGLCLVVPSTLAERTASTTRLINAMAAIPVAAAPAATRRLIRARLQDAALAVLVAETVD